MKTPLAIVLTALLSSSAIADDNKYNDSHSGCNVNLEHSVKVTPQYIQVLDGEKPLYRITDDFQLFIDGDAVSLGARQQELLEQYHALIEELAPKITQLLSQGLALVKQTIANFFSEMFGDDLDMQQQVEVITERFEQRLAPLLDENQGEYLISKDHLDATGHDLGKEISQDIAGLVKASAGQMLMFIGNMMMDGEDLARFEQRIEQLGQQMELKSKNIEQQANRMCQQLELLESLEGELQQAIPKLANYDLIKLESI